METSYSVEIIYTGTRSEVNNEPRGSLFLRLVLDNSNQLNELLRSLARGVEILETSRGCERTQTEGGRKMARTWQVSAFPPPHPSRFSLLLLSSSS